MTRLNGWLRIRILERDHYTCVYCGRRPPDVALEVDHVLARARGGSDDATNLVTACRDCNNGKRAGLIELPDTVVLAPLASKLHQRLQHVVALERAHAQSVTEIIASKRIGSLGGGSSQMDRPDHRIRRAPCDLCAHKADTIHFVPWIPSCHDVLFACEAHDPGGYWTLIETFDFDEGHPEYSMRSHILAKNDGWLALMLLQERLNGRKPYKRLKVNWRQAGSEQIERVWA